MSELLKVLDMTEKEKITWFYRRPEPELHNIVWVYPEDKFKDGMLADLAFRLQDEAARKYPVAYQKALSQVWKYYCDKLGYNTPLTCTYRNWIDMWVRPTDRIIAALTAKENE